METAVRKLVDVANKKIPLAPEVSYIQHSVITYSNIPGWNPKAGLPLQSDIYSDRLIRQEAIHLVLLNNVTVDREYMIANSEWIAKETQPPWRRGEAFPTNITQSTNILIDKADVLILARFGIGTWGHWLGELIPKLALVEHFFPGRFSYAIPSVFRDSFWANFIGCVRTYGVPDERIVFLDSGCNYTFPNAWAVTSTWSEHALHPNAAEAMRMGLKTLPSQSLGKRVALTRQNAAGRALVNHDVVMKNLAKRGFEEVDIARLDFSSQVDCFANAKSVFSILGSSLTGLIYSPVGVEVTSVAPLSFGDRFFYALCAERRASYADVRGPIVEQNIKVEHKSSFVVEENHVEEALSAVEEAHALRVPFKTACT